MKIFSVSMCSLFALSSTVIFAETITCKVESGSELLTVEIEQKAGSPITGTIAGKEVSKNVSKETHDIKESPEMLDAFRSLEGLNTQGVFSVDVFGLVSNGDDMTGSTLMLLRDQSGTMMSGIFQAGWWMAKCKSLTSL